MTCPHSTRRLLADDAARATCSRSSRFVTNVLGYGLLAVLTLCASAPAWAQTLKQTGVNVFNVLYGIVGVVGAIASIVTLLNWQTGNWFGRDDPKRLFIQVLAATALAFAVVAIIQFIKESVGGSASGISNL